MAVLLPFALLAMGVDPRPATDPQSGYPRLERSEHHEALGPVWVVKDDGGVARAVIYQDGTRLRADSSSLDLVNGPAELPGRPGLEADDFPLVVFWSYFGPPCTMRRCRDGAPVSAV